VPPAGAAALSVTEAVPVELVQSAHAVLVTDDGTGGGVGHWVRLATGTGWQFCVTPFVVQTVYDSAGEPCGSVITGVTPPLVAFTVVTSRFVVVASEAYSSNVSAEALRRA
jgi:hypothetical protein